MPRKPKTQPKTVLHKVIHAIAQVEKPSRQAIKKFLKDKLGYENDKAVMKAIAQGVKAYDLTQRGQMLYIRGKEPCDPAPSMTYARKDSSLEGTRYKPHAASAYMNVGYPKGFEREIELSGERSFLRFAADVCELSDLHKTLGDKNRAKRFREAAEYMLGVSDHNYEHNNKNMWAGGHFIGLGHDGDMSRDMTLDDVKCFECVYAVGQSTLELLEEFINTGRMKQLEGWRGNK